MVYCTHYICDLNTFGGKMPRAKIFGYYLLHESKEYAKSKEYAYANFEASTCWLKPDSGKVVLRILRIIK